MALGGGTEGPELPTFGGIGGEKGLDGDAAPTFGGFAGMAGLGFTSGGTMSDMSTLFPIDLRGGGWRQASRKQTKTLSGQKPIEMCPA